MPRVIPRTATCPVGRAAIAKTASTRWMRRRRSWPSPSPPAVRTGRRSWSPARAVTSRQPIEHTEPVMFPPVTGAPRWSAPSASQEHGTSARCGGLSSSLRPRHPCFAKRPWAFKAPRRKKRRRTNKNGVLASPACTDNFHHVYVDEWYAVRWRRCSCLLCVCEEECRAGRVR